MPLSKYKTEAEKLYGKDWEKALSDRKSLYTTEKSDINSLYDKQVLEEGKAYEDQYRENAVQKAINERQVAESIANLGLTNSGLNRTQQTAVQLSYANNNAAIDRQKQKAIDSYERARTQDLSTAKRSYLTDKATINQSYENQIAQTAQELYKKNLEEQTARQKAYYSAISKQAKADETGGILKVNGSNLPAQGTLKDNNISVSAIVKDGLTTGYKYVDNVTGKSSTFSVGVNPYTGTNNKDTSLNTDTTKAVEKYETFENGYQPKGIIYGGKDYGWCMSSGIKDYINGVLQNVHKTKDGSLWIWDRAQNKYRPYQE